MRKYLFTALAMVLTLLAAVSFSSAETKNWGPYEVEILDETERGAGGYGHTGVK